MRQRNRLLDTGSARPVEFEGLERAMAESGVAIAAARVATVDAIAATMQRRKARDPSGPFPWAEVRLDGTIDTELAQRPAVEVEDRFCRRLAETRDRDRAAGRTLEGPHRSDLSVQHGPKQMSARLCSTGEQKALLIGLVLAHAEMIATRASGAAPILLLDEIAAHLDADRRAALFDEIRTLGSQAWMTGTDATAFQAIADHADLFRVADGSVAHLA